MGGWGGDGAGEWSGSPLWRGVGRMQLLLILWAFPCMGEGAGLSSCMRGGTANYMTATLG